MAGKNGNGKAPPTANADPNRWTPEAWERAERLVSNITSMRDQFFSRFLDQGPRDVNRECMYPDSGQLNNPWYFRELYEREPIATRVVQLMPKESWQSFPVVYEDEDPDNDTPFEEAWDEMCRDLREGQSWYAPDDASPVFERLQRGDQLSGIGYFGVILIGIDDGRNLDQPADGVMSLQPVKNKRGKTVGCRMWPSQVRHVDPPVTNRGEWVDGKYVAGSAAAFKDLREPSPLMVPVVNRRTGAADFVEQERATKLVKNRKLVVNAPFGGTQVARGRAAAGSGPNQARHDPDTGGRASSGSGEPHQGDTFTSFAGAQGTDAQYVGVELSPPAYPSKEPSKQRRRLLFLRCFDEALVQIVQYEADVRNPRFGLPVMYRITLNDPSTQHSGVGLPLATVRVHWTRILHLADNLDSSEIFGVPRQRPVLNPILDVRKVRGSGAEGYWKSCFTGLALSTHPQLGGDVAVDEDKSKRVLQEFFMNLDRGMVLNGMAVSTIAPSVVDPTPHIQAALEAICIQLGCPMRVFKGSERGELASSQDDSSWNDRVTQRRKSYLTPRVIVPFIDRIIALGVLPEPKANKAPKKSAAASQDDFSDAIDGAVGGAPGSTDRVGEGRVNAPPADQDGWGPEGTNPPARNRRGSWTRREGRLIGRVVRNSRGRMRVVNADDEAAGDDAVQPDERVIGEKRAPGTETYHAPMGYSIEWPDIDSTTHKDRAAIALSETQALAAYVQGNVESIVPTTHYLTDVMQWPEERSRQIIDDARDEQGDTMTMPPVGADGHPTSEPPPPASPFGGPPPGAGGVGEDGGDEEAGDLGDGGDRPPGIGPQVPQPGVGAVARRNAGATRMPVPEPVQNSAVDDLRRGIVRAIREAMEEVDTGPDYQRCFLNERDRRAWWVSADSDEEEQVQYIKRKLGAVPGVESVTAEAEAFPPRDEEDWVEIYPRRAPWSNTTMNSNPEGHNQYTNQHSFERDLLGHSSPAERLEKWRGFGPIAGQQLKAYQNSLDRKRYIYLAPAEIKELQDAGYLSPHKKPRITPSGKEQMRKSGDAERADIQREVDEVNRPTQNATAGPKEDWIGYNPTEATGSEGEQVPRGTSSREDEDEDDADSIESTDLPSEDDLLQRNDPRSRQTDGPLSSETGTPRSKPTPPLSDEQAGHQFGGTS